MIRLKDVVIDCEHPASLARFWAGLLDDYDVAPYDDEEVARLATLGVTDLEDDPGVMVIGSSSLRLYFQRVPEPKVVKNRVHIDLQTDEPEAALARVVDLGGEVLQRHDNVRRGRRSREQRVLRHLVIAHDTPSTSRSAHTC